MKKKFLHSMTKEPGRLRFSRLLILIGIFILSAGIVTAACLAPITERFVILEEKTGKVLFYTGVKPKDTFTVLYTHSVNKSPVEDIFEIGEDYGIVIKKTIFRSFGAGIPCEPEGDQILNVYTDRMELDNINKRLDKYLLFVGIVANHTFIMGNHRIQLNQLTKPQTTVRFEVRKVPMYILIRGMKNGYK